jgi:hypothetical protein
MKSCGVEADGMLYSALHSALMSWGDVSERRRAQPHHPWRGPHGLLRFPYLTPVLLVTQRRAPHGCGGRSRDRENMST